MNLNQIRNIVQEYIDKNKGMKISIILDSDTPLGEGYIYFTEKMREKIIYCGAEKLNWEEELDEEKVFLFCKNCFHEKTHLVQKFYIFHKEKDALAKEMAKEILFTRYNQGLYHTNYESLLHEIHAEYNALKELPEFFEKNFPDFDFRKVAENFYSKISKEEEIVKFVKLDGKEKYEEILEKFNKLLKPENFPKKNFDLEKINKAGIYSTFERDLIVRFLDAYNKNEELQESLSKFSVIEQDDLLTALNYLASNSELVSLERKKDFNKMFSKYKTLETVEKNKLRELGEKLLRNNFDFENVIKEKQLEKSLER